jgi:hypothetical protein
MDKVKLPYLVLNSNGMYFKQEDDTYVTFDELLLAYEDNKLTDINFKNHYQYKDIHTNDSIEVMESPQECD